MKQEGKIKGMVYEASLKEGSRIYRVFQNDKLIAEGNQKELPLIPRRFMEEGLNDIAHDMIESLPNLKWCTCEICGDKYISSASRNKTCSEVCRTERHLRRKRKQPIEKKQTENVALKARELGISYGEYRAIQYMKRNGMACFSPVAHLVD